MHKYNEKSVLSSFMVSYMAKLVVNIKKLSFSKVEMYEDKTENQADILHHKYFISK